MSPEVDGVSFTKMEQLSAFTSILIITSKKYAMNGSYKCHVNNARRYVAQI